MTNSYSLLKAAITNGREVQLRIAYCQTPPEWFRNFGDHGQAVEGLRWTRTVFDAEVIEFDKQATVAEIRAVNPSLIFLASGGNFANRATMTHPSRLTIIAACRDLPIVQLQQTFALSESLLRKTQQVFADHPKLFLVGRDPTSRDLFAEHFPQAAVRFCWDFCFRHQLPTSPTPSTDVLFCFRHAGTGERTVTEKTMAALQLAVDGRDVKTIDTGEMGPVKPQDREGRLREVVEMFSRFAAVFTDRFHGFVFSIAARRPVVALPTADAHKLHGLSGLFAGVDGVHFADLLPNAAAVRKTLQTPHVEPPDFEPEFTALAQSIQNWI